MNKWIRYALAAAALAASANATLAQDYPTKPIRMLVGFAVGGGTDILARDIATRLSKVWNQSVIVENRIGANGNIATTDLAKSAPDGHTLLVTVPSLITNAMLDPNFKYNPLEDFVPITVIATAPYVITVMPNFPAKTTRELIAMAKEKPGSINWGSPGVASSPHLTGELFNSAANISMTHIPYKGGSQVVAAMLSGELALSFFTTIQAMPLLNDGKMRAIAVSSPKRSSLLPNVPTITESGVPGYEADAWWGVFAPKGTPPAVVAKLQKAISDIIRTDEMKQRLASQSSEPGGNTSEEFARDMKREYGAWEALFKKVSIKLE